MTTESERPHHEISAPPIYAAIWRTTIMHNGRRIVEFSTRVQKRYRDQRSGEWKTTNFFPRLRPSEVGPRGSPGLRVRHPARI